MNSNYKEILLILTIIPILMFGCADKNKDKNKSNDEDRTAKQMLQGIWVDSDADNVAFKAKGDTIYYPDTTSMPVHFQIIHDSLILHSASGVRYQIIKQTPNLFIFRNQNNEQVKLMRSENENDKYLFDNRHPRTLNQNKLIKSDTILAYSDKKYHSYVQINPTTYKVIKPTYNDDGVEVDNVYHDNIIHISLFNGSKKVFSRDFKKQDFTKQVPAEILNQSILSDVVFKKIDANGVHYNAFICIPDDLVGYLVEITIAYNGTMSLTIANG